MLPKIQTEDELLCALETLGNELYPIIRRDFDDELSLPAARVITDVLEMCGVKTDKAFCSVTVMTRPFAKKLAAGLQPPEDPRHVTKWFQQGCWAQSFGRMIVFVEAPGTHYLIDVTLPQIKVPILLLKQCQSLVLEINDDFLSGERSTNGFTGDCIALYEKSGIMDMVLPANVWDASRARTIKQTLEMSNILEKALTDFKKNGGIWHRPS